MPTFRTPGVYVEEITAFPAGIGPVDTAVPAFIGYTERATAEDDGDLTLKPKHIASLAEYERHFGGPQPETGLEVTITETTTAAPAPADGISATATIAETDRSKHVLHYALQLFYANGGESCVVVSAGGYKAVTAELLVTELTAALETLSRVDEPTLIVIPEAQALSVADYAALQDAALAQCNDLKDRFVILDVHGDGESLSDPDADLLAAVRNFRSSGPSQFLKYGAAYAPNIVTTLDFAYDASAVQVSHAVDGGAPTTAALSTLEATDHQLYHRAKAALQAEELVLPPSGAIAGVYARVDADRGVWKPPANVALTAVVRPAIEVGDATNDAMNVDAVAGKSVNAIRRFAGTGTLVWGARTLAGNDNEWRYVSVRRFVIFAEETLRRAIDQFIFEPNDTQTWVRVQAFIEGFLTDQWRAGALQGVKPEHAFYVAVGLGRTMTARDVSEGRMIVEVGMAAVRPEEFIVLRLVHTMAES